MNRSIDYEAVDSRINQNALDAKFELRIFKGSQHNATEEEVRLREK